MKKLLSAIVLCSGLAMAAEAPTPYDLIRPTWPVTWDSTVFNSFAPGAKSNSIPTRKTPADYSPNGIIPDTVNQAYLDAMNVKMSRIRVNQAGYRPGDQKMFYYVGTATTFDVVDLSGNVLGTGTFAPTNTNTQSSWKVVAANNAQRSMNIRYTVSSTGPSGSLLKGFLPDGLPTEQRMRVKVGSDLSADFIVSEKVYSMVRDASLKFFGINRSGNSESWFHPPSHLLDGSVGGTPGSLAGGWYDCGDHLKESQTQSYALATITLMAAAHPQSDEDHYAYNQGEVNNTDGIPDLLREAKQGADFILKAYDRAGGVIVNVAASVGDFGEHGWWGRPEYADFALGTVAGPTTRVGRSDAGAELQLASTASGDYAAGLAILSKMYVRYDADFAAKCLVVAKALYEYGKEKKTKASSGAYNGSSTYHDEMGLAAICLFYATADKYYLNDAVENKSLALGQTKADFLSAPLKGAGMFNGGWFAHTEASFLKSGANTDWASVFTHGLYAFYKLILATKETAASYGLTDAQRLTYAEDVALTMAANIGSRQEAYTAKIPLPVGNAAWNGAPAAAYDPTWFTMKTQQDWVWNRYQAGNIFDILSYADVTKDLEGVTLPQLGKQTWNSSAMTELGVNQMNFMLGVNPWDFSMVLGIGDKNDAHPHHRAANPEGKNVPGGDYKYRPPTGALFGGIPPSLTNPLAPTNFPLSWESWWSSETCIDATATFIAPTVMLAKEEDMNRPPVVNVEIKYVGFDSAIVVIKQDLRGSSTIHYGTSATSLTSTVSSTTDANMHTLVLKPLANGSIYYFYVTSSNVNSGNESTRYLVDSTLTPYTFTTLSTAPAAADIQNIKVCNVSADSAEIMWYTPNGEYESAIYWDTVPQKDYKNMAHSQFGDFSGFPTKFHYMKIGGLKEHTTYYYAVESNGVGSGADESGNPLTFTTPVTQYDFSIRTSTYTLDLDYIEMNVYNNEPRPFDSLTVRVYMRGTDAIYKDIGMRTDICYTCNEAGNTTACTQATLDELNAGLRKAFPTKIDDTYDPVTGTWQWYFPIPLGSTVIKSSSRMRVDVAFDTRSPWPPYMDLMNQRPVKTPGKELGDWSWDPHSRANGEPADFAGMLHAPKNFGDDDLAPINPYMTVYRKDEFVWGYSPSRSEMATKRANYKISTNLDAPFNVSNGTYVELNQATSTVHVKGKAYVTEGGVINAIWVNGNKLTDISTAAIYNATDNVWNLDIPAKLTIGANKVDVTIFAGPSLDCEACQENGGCAFENHNYFIQFAKGNLTASSLTITDVATKAAVASPAIPGKLSFTVQVRDGDKLKAKPATLDVKVINPRKLDTLVTKVTLTGDYYESKTPIAAVNKDKASRGANEISFFGGDTVYVRYIDPDDGEDSSQQSFYAKPQFPTPVKALVRDGNCDGIMDTIDVEFSQTFSAGDSLIKVGVVAIDPVTNEKDSFTVAVTEPVVGKSRLTIPLPERSTLPKTGGPKGTFYAYIQGAGTTMVETPSVVLSDGINPVLLSVSLLENPPESRSAQDTLKIAFSEPVTLGSKRTWPLLIFNSGKEISTSSITIAVDPKSTDGGRSWLYVVEGNTDGAIIDSGFTAKVKADYSVVDMGLNALYPDSTCSEPVTIIEVPKPVPVTLAEMHDRDGDGSADSLFLQFEKKLRPKDLLDSFVVTWGTPAVKYSFLPDAAHIWPLSADSTQILLTFKDSTFAYGATQGSDKGQGRVLPRLGPAGGFFDKDYAVLDKIGPVILSARKGVMLGSDTMVVVLSEPVDSIAGAYMLERRRSGAAGIIFIPTHMTRRNDSTYVFFFGSDVQGAVRVGDRVRLVPSPAAVKDKSGNLPGIDNPWVEVKGELSDKITYTVDMVQGVSGSNKKLIEAGYTIDPPGENDHFRLTILDPRTGNEIKLGEGFNTIASDLTGMEYDTSSYNHLGPTFTLKILMPSAMIKVGEASAWDYTIKIQLNVFDNLGQFINTATYSYDLDKVGREYLTSDGEATIRIEWMVHGNSSPKSITGRLVATGAYIGSFQFNATAVALVDDQAVKNDKGVVTKGVEFRKGERVKSSDTKRKTFGLRRSK